MNSDGVGQTESLRGNNVPLATEAEIMKERRGKIENEVTPTMISKCKQRCSVKGTVTSRMELNH